MNINELQIRANGDGSRYYWIPMGDEIKRYLGEDINEMLETYDTVVIEKTKSTRNVYDYVGRQISVQEVSVSPIKKVSNGKSRHDNETKRGVSLSCYT